MRALLVLLLAGCGASNTQLGRDRYEINCENGIAECRQMAGKLCPEGYIVESGKSGTFVQTIVARCKPSAAESWTAPAPVAKPTPPAPSSPPVQALPPGIECVRDFQCTKPDARCVDGKCVAPPQTLTVEESNRCVVGTPGRPDPTPIFPTETAAVEFAKYMAPDQAAAFNLVVKLGGTWVDAGVRCRTMRPGAQARYIQLLSGPLAGREGWLGTSPAAPVASAQPKDAGVD